MQDVTFLLPSDITIILQEVALTNDFQKFVTSHPQYCEHNELCEVQNYLHIKYALVYFSMLSASAAYSRD
jgi:hypothetical protein